jgi:hypothetical protein
MADAMSEAVAYGLPEEGAGAAFSASSNCWEISSPTLTTFFSGGVE